MGVFSNQSVDFTAAGAEMASAARLWMNASIQIIDPNTENAEWNEWTNEYTGGNATVLWSGPARVQHLKYESSQMAAFGELGIRGIRIQVPLDVEMGFVRKGLQVIVTDGGNDVELEQLSYVVTSAINSSFAWLRTIEAEVDIKSVADSTWAGIAGTVTTSGSPLSDVTIRTFHHEDDLWIMDYETTTDVLGNYEIPADAGVPVVVVASKALYITQYYEDASSFGAATTVTPTNHVETQNIDLSLVLD